MSSPPPVSASAPVPTLTDAKSEAGIAEPSLPKLSAGDQRLYEKLAVMMDYYHNKFRSTWSTIYTACENNQRPRGTSMKQFLNMGLEFVDHITRHHDIEERYIFPILGEKMPEFGRLDATPDATPDATYDARAQLMVLQHIEIHAGLHKLESYLEDCNSSRRDLRLQGDGSLKEVMDTFGAVLWEHLDEEVRLLGAENMRKYWSTNEMKRFNF